MKNGKKIPTLDELIKKHKVSRKYLEHQLAMGTKVEHEHTKNNKVAMGIALQHLDEFPDYYTNLLKMEKQEKKKMAVKEQSEQIRYCPKCQKNEMREECSYGEKYWDMFSLPAMSVSIKKPFSIAKIHPANEETELQSEACWKGYKQLGMKKKGKRKVPNCVPVDESCGCEHTFKKKKKKEKEEVTENYSRINELGGTYTISLIWRNKTFVLQIFFPSTKVPSRAEVKAQIEKVYPGSYLVTYRPSTIDPTKPLLFKTEEYSQVDEDWQKVNRKDNTDGLSREAVKAYRRENPGSKLQTAVTEKNPKGKRAKRRSSFCRRMGGMKKKLTSAKTANNPDSRINKALRRWNC